MEMEPPLIRSLRLKRYYLVIGWGMVLAVTYLSLMPRPPKGPDIPHADKYLHLVAYFVMTFWFGMVYARGAAHFVAFVGLTMFGVVIESGQGFLGFRSFDVMDMAANGAGAFIGWLLALTPASNLLEAFEAGTGLKRKGRPD